jgi:MFS family permease
LIAIYTSVRAPVVLLLLGPLVAFFATGYFSGFGAVTAEIYPTDIRATAQGLTYNLGRIASAAAPFTVGALAQTRGFDVALSTTSIAFIAAALMWIWIPETRGRSLA